MDMIVDILYITLERGKSGLSSLSSVECTAKHHCFNGSKQYSPHSIGSSRKARKAHTDARTVNMPSILDQQCLGVVSAHLRHKEVWNFASVSFHKP